MININLLPEELRPQPRSPLPYLMAMVLAVAVVFYCLISFYTLHARNSALKNSEAEFKTKIAEVRDSVEAVKELEKKKRELNAKQIAIGKIWSDRLLWSKVLYDLAGLVPENVWLSDIKEEVKVTTVQVKNPDPKASQPTRSVKKTERTLVVGGYALSLQAEQGVELVGQLVRAMEKSPEFSRNFRNPTPQGVYDDEFDKFSVKKFEIKTNIVTRGAPG